MLARRRARTAGRRPRPRGRRPAARRRRLDDRRDSRGTCGGRCPARRTAPPARACNSLSAVSGAPSRVFVARLAGLAVFDPLGDQVGRVRDVVAVFRPGKTQPARCGLVVEVPGRRRVFVPMTRVTSIDAGQVITTGLVNMRRFEQRPTETLVLAELLDRTVRAAATAATTVDGRGRRDGAAAAPATGA